MVLDASSLTAPETVTVTAEPSQSPEPTRQLEELQRLNETARSLEDQAAGLRALGLLSGGLTICLLAAIFARSRK